MLGARCSQWLFKSPLGFRLKKQQQIHSCTMRVYIWLQHLTVFFFFQTTRGSKNDLFKCTIFVKSSTSLYTATLTLYGSHLTPIKPIKSTRHFKTNGCQCATCDLYVLILYCQKRLGQLRLYGDTSTGILNLKPMHRYCSRKTYSERKGLAYNLNTA